MRQDDLAQEYYASKLARHELGKSSDLKLREALVRRARQLETARQINLWRTSPEHTESE